MRRPELFRRATEQLRAAGVDNPRLEARLLLEHAFDADRAPAAPAVDETSQAAFARLLARRLVREPLAYILGRKEFWSLEFEVGPGALVPRPETETLIEQLLAAFPDRAAPLRILDLGTGSGCLLVAALSLYPSAIGTGVDASPDAMAWARRNLGRHGLEDRAILLEGDWMAGDGPFDVVLANPPYLTTVEMAAIAPELRYEPASALEAGADGLDAYRALGSAIFSALAPEGRAFIEIGAGQGTAAGRALEAGGLEIGALHTDLSGIPRCIVTRRRGPTSVPEPEKTVGKLWPRG